MNIYRRVLAYYRPFSGRILFSVGLLLVAIGLNLLKPWPLKIIVDDILHVSMQGREVVLGDFSWTLSQALMLVCGAMIIIHLLWGVCNLWNSYWLIDIGLRALLKLRTELYSTLQALPLRFHDSRRSADSTFRVAYDAQAIQTFFNRGFATVVGSGIMLVGTFAVMWSMNSRLTLVSLGVIPLLLACIFFYAQRIRQQTSELQQEENDVLARASEGLSGIRVIHAFGREKHEVAQFVRECSQSMRANLRLTMTNVSSTLVVGLIVAAGSALLLYYGAEDVLQGKMTLGELLVFTSYLAMLYQPLEQLSYTAWAMEGAAAGVQRSFEILDAKNDVPDSPQAKPFVPSQGNIVFDSVHFAYTPEHPILNNISLEIKQGETVALVGGTGAGKTTLMSLVPRFYDPQQGKVLIDGQDIKSVQKHSLRQNIAMVLQDTLLFNTTIRENIAYGKLNATAEEVYSAAVAAQADEFIRQLPQGYDTLVGERGVLLSGGQRQRIGIARAFLKQASILLLDEPTSALDLETESEIMKTLALLMKNPTTLIVTHRLSTIHNVDRICVLENGRVVEQGRGAELLEQRGVYWRLWNASSNPS